VSDPIAPPVTPPPAASDAVAPPTPSAQADGAAVAAPSDSRIGIDQFMSVELRVAKVLTAERVPKSKKLMQLRIDVGTEERTIVAGIAEAYEPEALVGRLIVVVANLKPAKLMGIESNGMVLASSSEAGKPILVAPGEGAVPGDRVR
jgi:methionyl-tRNA synthetase